MSYIIGAVARIKAQFSVDGVLTDPTTIALAVKSGTSGTITNYAYPATITKLAIGIYQAQVPVTEVGQWFYRWTSTGAAAGAAQSWFQVDPNTF